TLSFSQTRTVSGTVSDSSGNPLPSVTVAVKGKQIATTTARDGTFSLGNITSTDVLVFSYVGHTPVERRVGSGSAIFVSFTAAGADLGEVIVIGYGSARKTDLTGSVASISSKDFQKGQMSTPEQLIAGKLPGVSIISNSGQPGSGSTIRIRGGSSLRASNDPLIVIDGVPLETGAISGAGDPLSFINPNDIETFTVLKDASAAAIYGTRAANGVLIITTRKGAGGKLNLNFSTIASVQILQKRWMF
ncbi:MAG TPA: TonB-dependent receptor plug domain-containing protein, partial [Flavitalea sp.]|nr:TonB-dependent receptor plug domain-containing protein [Flavitalea sp.]